MLILTVTSLILSQVPADREVKLPGVFAIAASGDGRIFATGQGEMSTPWFAVVSKKGELESQVTLKGFGDVIGADEFCKPVLFGGSETLQTPPGEESYQWQPARSPMVLRGQWALREHDESLVVFRKASAVRVISEVGGADSYGLDRDSGRVAVIKRVGRIVRLTICEPKSGAQRSMDVSGPSGTFIEDSSPYCSLEFIDKDNIACYLRLARSSKEGKQDRDLLTAYLCRVSIKTGVCVPIRPAEIIVADAPLAWRKDLAVLPDGTFVVAGMSKLVLIDKNSRATIE